MNKHQVGFTYLSQDGLLQDGAFHLRGVFAAAVKALLDFEDHTILFPVPDAQIFNNVKLA